MSSGQDMFLVWGVVGVGNVRVIRSFCEALRWFATLP